MFEQQNCLPATLNHLDTPLLITDHQMRILWMNQSMSRVEQGGFAVGTTLDEVFVDHREELQRLTVTPGTPVHLTLSLLYTTFEARASLLSPEDERILWNFIKQPSPSELDFNEALLQQQTLSVKMHYAYQRKVAAIYNHLIALKKVSSALAPPDTENPLKVSIREIARHCCELDRLLINQQKFHAGGADYQQHQIQQMQTISLAPYLEKLLQEIRRLSGYPEEKITWEIVDPQLLVRMVPQTFEIALCNLLAQAYDFSPPEGQIHVRLFKQNNSATITIQDEGVGTATREEFPLVDLLPDQVETFTKRLLYPVAKRIIESHGGTLSAIRAKNRGSIVSIRLPLSKVEREDLQFRAPEPRVFHKLSNFHLLLATSCDFDLI